MPCCGCNHPAEATEHCVCGHLLPSTIKSLIFTLLLLAALLKAPHPGLPSSPLLTPTPRCCFSQGFAIKVENLPHPLSQPAGELPLLSSQQSPEEDGGSSKAEKGQDLRKRKNFYKIRNLMEVLQKRGKYILTAGISVQKVENNLQVNEVQLMRRK